MNHMFMTGGTGVIGSALIPRLLSMPNTYLTVLMRATSDAVLEARRSQLVDFCGIRNNETSDRIHFVIGDVCEDHLGLAASEYKELLNNVSGIVHCAGNVKLNQSIGAARRNAGQATSEILTFARRANQLQKVDVVSTIGVAGRLSGIIPEQRISEPREYHNNYEQAKAEAENLLWSGIDEGLPITIHRPSMVVGDSRNGAIVHYQVFYYLCDYLSGRRTRGILPMFGESVLDIVPCDFVADVIFQSCHAQDAIGRVFNLCAGNVPEMKLSALCRTIRPIYESLGHPCPRQRFIPVSAIGLLAQALSWVGPKPIRKSFSTLPYFLTYLRQRQQFSVANTTTFVEANEIPRPHINDYLRTVLTPYIRGKKQNLPTGIDLMPCVVSSLRSNSLPVSPDQQLFFKQ